MPVLYGYWPTPGERFPRQAKCLKQYTLSYMKTLLKKVKAKVLNGNSKPLLTAIRYEKPFLHIGCGDINLQGWINIDARPANHVHILTNKITLDEFADESIGVIYLSHVLEHFDFNESSLLLQTFYRKLKKGGVLLIAVPDFAALVNVYNQYKNLPLIEKALMGGQQYQYNYHKSVYDKSFLTKKLLDAGFSHAELYDTRDEFGKEIGDFSTYRIHEQLISLNMRAIK